MSQYRGSSARAGLGYRSAPCDFDKYDHDDIPLQHKKPFGAGLKRKRAVAFVRASDPELHTTTLRTPPSQAASASEDSVADLYLNLVMKEGGDAGSEHAFSGSPADASERPPSPQHAAAPKQTCPVCNVALDESSDLQKHEASIPHQVALSHSHPPSSIDRSRMGLSYLSSFGWDPDARRGLGAEGQGIRDPIKVQPKDDTLGLGAVIPQEFIEKAKEPKPKKLSIKDLRKREAEEKRKADRLRDLFYRSDDVLRHLEREV
ncbi:hypothetical protein VUR80DRAFT_10103 [Thermomyces stellatus]